MKLASIFAAGTLIAAGVAVAQPATEGGRKLNAELTGAAEVPNPGDADGSGSASVTVNPGQKRVCYELEVTGIAAATAAHIHEAPAGTAGGVVVTLEAPADGDSSGCVEVSRELALEILKRPADYYVNVHNAEFPGGALRGQLGK
ncbi:CHRD domain-containing protein [Sphingomonas xanthus]|uniref:CHRD domain-containing protein n=1 Tax=Sphingomonas xanthus TaxID=2594473 RepID=A0A516IPJ6_9SPHN|nr:CHRD domain-containing protein [Sphingomonas xanthus]QDP18858.1 CHRD domain-containing protein [Sphingomonas xanthus]